MYVLSWMTALLALVPAPSQFFDASAWDIMRGGGVRTVQVQSVAEFGVEVVGRGDDAIETEVVGDSEGGARLSLELRVALLGVWHLS
jgi:hypothetical protein